MDNQNGEFQFKGIKQQKINMRQISDRLFVPAEDENEGLKNVYAGFGFEEIQADIFGNSRGRKNMVGAAAGPAKNSMEDFDKNIYGPDWFSPEKAAAAKTIISVSPGDVNIAEKIVRATAGDVLEFAGGAYQIETSLRIDKKISLRAKSNAGKVSLIFSGERDTPLFEMHPGGYLNLDHISIQGNQTQYAFAPLAENMSRAYGLKVENSDIANFKNILKAYKGSFADSISFLNSDFQNCINGIQLDAETDDKGDYNAEFVTIKNCNFRDIQKEVINFYRGGYDESTIGGNLFLRENQFVLCGKREPSKILLKTRGIINVDISDNMFKDNPVKLVALLWGEKNNRHSGNKMINSGKLRVDQYLKQKLVY